MSLASNLLSVLQQNSNSQNEILERRLLEMIVLEQKNFVFTNLGRKDTIPMNQGTVTKKYRRYNHLPVSNHKLTEGVPPTALKVEAQTVTAAVNQFGAYLDVTDVGDEVHLDDILNVYQPELARHAAEVKERDVIAGLTDTSEYYVDAAGAANTAKTQLTSADVLTLKDCRVVALTMKNQRRLGHRATGGKFLFVVHTNTMADLLDDVDLEEKILATGMENSPIKNGSLDNYKMYGFVVQETLIAPVEEVNIGTEVAPSMLNVYTTFALGRDPYVVLSMGGVKWIRKGFTADSGDPLAQIASLGYKFWSGVKVLDPFAITKIYHVSAYDMAFPDFTDDDLARAASQV